MGSCSVATVNVTVDATVDSMVNAMVDALVDTMVDATAEDLRQRQMVGVLRCKPYRYVAR